MKGGAFMEYSYRFRIYPTEKQKELITKTFGCCRYVFNYFLDRRKAVYKATGKGLPLKDCTRELTALKKGLPWLQEVDATSLQAAVQNLDRAYVNFIRGHKTGITLDIRSSSLRKMAPGALSPRTTMARLP